MTETTWLDPARPGWPLNPEKDGWHWVENKFTGDRRAALWLTDLHWGLRVPTHEMAEACIYLGPVLTPEEEAALQKRVVMFHGLTVQWAEIIDTLRTERDQLIGALQVAVERSGDLEPTPSWLDGACGLLNQGFLNVDRAALAEAAALQKRVAELRQIIRYVAGCEHATASDEDLLEQVAAAICRMNNIDPTGHISIDGSAYDWGWKHYLPQARAALGMPTNEA